MIFRFQGMSKRLQMRIECSFVAKVFVLAYFASKFVTGFIDEFANFFDNGFAFQIQRIGRMFGFNMVIHVIFLIKSCWTFQAYKGLSLSMGSFVMFTIGFYARKRFFASTALAVLNFSVFIRELVTNDHQMTVTTVMLV